MISRSIDRCCHALSLARRSQFRAGGLLSDLILNITQYYSFTLGFIGGFHITITHRWVRLNFPNPNASDITHEPLYRLSTQPASIDYTQQ